MTNISLEQAINLENRFGCPLYIFNEKEFVENYKEFGRILTSYYPKYHIAYSYKTNYTPYICNIVKELGGYAEVVSGMERFIAKKIGYEDDKIIYNGPNKGLDGIEAIQSGAIVNADNLVELRNISDYVKKDTTGEYRIGLRVNLDIGQDFISRFGMDIQDIEAAFQIVSSISNLSIVGLHCHISRCRGLYAWEKRTELMLELADRFFKESPPQYIDLGSGMFGKMDPSLSAQFENIPTYMQYAMVTAKIVAEHYKGVDESSKPILFTEPGTTLINKYIDFLCCVDSIKKLRGKAFLTFNCSEHNLGETSMLKQLPIKVIKKSKEQETITNGDFVGYTCLEQDVFYKDYNGNIGVGDYVLFGNVGGYSNVYKPPFIRPNCAMIAITESGEVKTIKQSETYEDILRTYSF